MPTRLIALYAGPDLFVDESPVLVGRSRQCDARIDSILVSRLHCCLIEIAGEVVVRDLGSTNGIRINGRPVESGRLRPGDELMIGMLRYRVGDGWDDMATRIGRRGDLDVGKSVLSPSP
jgi:pSer/pThr/pTyr-binding forkhead associated (FHA) protein